MMEKISTLKVGAVMLVMGPFLWFLDEVFVLMPSGIVYLPGADAILYLLSVAVAAGMYISIAGFLLLIKHHFEVEAGDERIYRFVDYALASYIVLELLAGVYIFFPIPFAHDLP